MNSGLQLESLMKDSCALPSSVTGDKMSQGHWSIGLWREVRNEACRPTATPER